MYDYVQKFISDIDKNRFLIQIVEGYFTLA